VLRALPKAYSITRGCCNQQISRLHPLCLCPSNPLIFQPELNKNDINAGRQRFNNISEDGVAWQTHHSKTNYVLTQNNKGEKSATHVAAGGCELCAAIILSVDAMLTGRGQISAFEKHHPSVRPPRTLRRFPQTQELHARPPDSASSTLMPKLPSCFVQSVHRSCQFAFPQQCRGEVWCRNAAAYCQLAQTHTHAARAPLNSCVLHAQELSKQLLETHKVLVALSASLNTPNCAGLWMSALTDVCQLLFVTHETTISMLTRVNVICRFLQCYNIIVFLYIKAIDDYFAIISVI
jgi:hypothetical protein